MRMNVAGIMALLSCASLLCGGGVGENSLIEEVRVMACLGGWEEAMVIEYAPYDVSEKVLGNAFKVEWSRHENS